jgi:DNA modification methylase
MPIPTSEDDIWDFDENGTRYEICYTPESIRHPAKMHLPMCREIIKRYTKPGDLVFDCMAGIGTTIIEGMILGRNVIGIEYEQKFVDMAQKNIDKTKANCSFFKGVGIGKIIKGDSRELVKALNGVWAENIIFSPPFAEIIPFHDQNFVLNGRRAGDTNGVYSDDKNDKGNIANLKYKPIDDGTDSAIITSPPFASVTMEKPPSDKWQGPDFTQQTYSADKEDKGQIANLKYPDNGIDNSIVTSPPFMNENKGGGLQTRRLAGELTKDDIRMGNCIKQLSEDPQNIDNMKTYGSADSIITSPPFEDNLADFSKFTPPHDSRSNLDKHDHTYSDDPANCGNLQGSTYLSEMLKIYQQCYLVLKNEGNMILVTKNFTRSGKEVRLDLDTIKLCEQAGFELVARHYRKIKNPSFWIQNAIIKWNKKHPGVPAPYPLFEDILVFRKRRHEDAEREREIDNIMFSPPFAVQNQGTETFVGHPDECDCTFCHGHKKGTPGRATGDKYSDDPNNLGNLKYGG